MEFNIKYLDEEIFIKNFEKSKKYGTISLQKKFLPLLKIKNAEKNPLKATKHASQELRKMLKKQQKMTKINQKNMILMSEKNLVTLINKGFSQKCSKNSESIKIRIETLL